MPRTSTQKMRDYRGRLRAKGLRPLQLWVPILQIVRIADCPGFFDVLLREPLEQAAKGCSSVLPFCIVVSEQDLSWPGAAASPGFSRLRPSGASRVGHLEKDSLRR